MSAAQRAVQLTSHFGERDRAGDRSLADALLDIYARHGLHASVVLRGVQGFGRAHRRHTDRLLSLADDLPLVAVAIDRRPRILAALEEQRALAGRGPGLVTLQAAAPAGERRGPGDAARLTVLVGGRERVGRQPADTAVVGLLRERGIAGATVLPGIDGTAQGVRPHARLLGRGAAAPAMVVAVGDAARVAAAVPALRAMLARPLVTVEPVTILKRDGARVAGAELPGASPGDADTRVRITVFACEQARHHGRPLHRALVEELARAGAAGATSLRGTWGYAGAGAPHGDTAWQLRRRVPVVVSVVDAAPRLARAWAVVDALTDEAGLVTATTLVAPRAHPQRAAPGRPREPAIA